MSNQTKQTAKAAGKSAPSPNKSKEDKVLTELRNKLLNLHEENRILRENALHYKNVNPNQMKQEQPAATENQDGFRVLHDNLFSKHNIDTSKNPQQWATIIPELQMAQCERASMILTTYDERTSRSRNLREFMETVFDSYTEQDRIFNDHKPTRDSHISKFTEIINLLYGFEMADKGLDDKIDLLLRLSPGIDENDLSSVVYDRPITIDKVTIDFRRVNG
jgi:hypothetical protein